MTLRLLLADDHAVVRDGLRALLHAEPDMRVVASVANGRDAIAAAIEHAPDLAVVDIRMPGLNGIELAHRLREAAPATRVLVLSMHGTSEHVFRAFQAGARGYLLKDAAGADLVGAIRTVMAGKRYLSARINAAAVDAQLHRERSPLESLSQRERELLQLLAEGHGNREAARRLSLSVKTVETYRSRMLVKLGVADVTALVRFAIEHGIA